MSEEVLGALCVMILGGALLRWVRHSKLRIAVFTTIAGALTARLTQAERFHPEELWLALIIVFVLALVGAYLIGLVLRSRTVRAAKGGAILLSKNVDALADVARRHDEANPSK